MTTTILYSAFIYGSKNLLKTKLKLQMFKVINTIIVFVYTNYEARKSSARSGYAPEISCFPY